MTAIRAACLGDAAAIALLSGQLGYPSSEPEIRARLEALGSGDDVEILVVELAGAVAGWVGVRADLSLETGEFAEIVGLVVDEAHRGRGLGEALVEAAEHWAKGRGRNRLRVRSNVVRERAHRFYERLGYVESKRQAVFDKSLR